MLNDPLVDKERVGRLIDALQACVMQQCHTPVVGGAAVPATENLTFFHSQNLPRPTVRAMIRAAVNSRIAFDWTTAAMAVSLVMRYRRVHGAASVTPHMLHRLAMAALLVAAKANQDLVPTNKLVANTIGIPVRELARLEAYLCDRLDWHLQVTHDDLVLDDIELIAASASIPATTPLCGRSDKVPERVLNSPASASSHSGHDLLNHEDSADFVAASTE